MSRWFSGRRGCTSRKSYKPEAHARDCLRNPSLALRACGLPLVRATWIAACIGALGLAVVAGCGPAPTNDAEAQNADEPLARVATIKPQRKTLERRCEQPGEVVPLEQTPVYAKIAGFVETVLVDIGDQVKMGQTLAVVSVPELQEELKQKEALVAQAQSQIAQSAAAVDVARAVVETAQAKVAAAQAEISKADADCERWKSESARVNELAKTEAVTRKLADEVLQQFRAAEASKQAADAGLLASKAGVRESESRLQEAKTDVQASHARLEVVQAERDRTAAMLSYTQIKAPFAGVVTRRYIHTGHYVQPVTPGRDQPLFDIIHNEVARIVVHVPESEAGFVNKGDPAIVRVPALDSRQFHAAVTRSAALLDPETRTLRTEIEIENSAGDLQPGMYCQVSILVEKRPDALVIPLAAVLDVEGQPMCAAVVDGRIQRVPILLGLRAGKEVEVVSGLRGDEELVARNPGSFRDRQHVEILSP
jgi:HlyD family secretion protein